MSPPRIDLAERRRRVGVRHRLAPAARHADPVVVAGDLVGLHGSDPATVFLAAGARSPAPDVAAVERALYDDRTLVRTLGMRRTIFVLPTEVVPVVQAAVTDDLVAGERRKLVHLVEGQGVARDGARWLARVEAATVAEIEARGEATGAELARAVPGLDVQLRFGEGTTWAGTVGMSTRVLFLLATEQRIVRGRPNGAWTSSQYRWAPMSAWLDEPVAVPADAARVDLARRWLATFGPATVDDLRWWTGWTLGRTRAALAGCEVTEVDLDEGGGGTTPGVALADDTGATADPGPWVALLPGLDPTTMGWKRRGWYLDPAGPHVAALFDRNGNAGPTVWCDGRVVGGWAQHPDGRVVTHLLEDVGAEASAAVATEAARLGESLAATLGDRRVRPRFPTPLQRALERDEPWP